MCGGKSEDTLPGALRNNPGKTASPYNLPEHPYHKGQGDPNCPECRRQGLVHPGRRLSDDNHDGREDELCPLHRLAFLAAVRQSRKEVKEWMEEYIPKNTILVYELNIRNISTIEIRMSAIKAALSKPHSNPLLRDYALQHLEEVLKKSVYAGWAEDEVLESGLKKHSFVDYWLYYKTDYGYINIKRMDDGSTVFYCIDEDINPNIKEGDPIR